ncbi:DUF7674 family protein [Candidatus Paracaedibacter symbiosus]|uniref:DUF7674 family protein n=1 Tax=Candidatus Paracaedibacter symbiosus TaxID=244582 RepID=UPI00068E9DA3|nr:hypothetical protein [Candidatus Paracaedibacter symbiosus]
MRKSLTERYESSYFTKVTLRQIYEIVLQTCPAFEEIFLSSDDKDLPYSIAGDFAEYIVALYKEASNNPKVKPPLQKELRNISALIHCLIKHPDEKVSEWAVIGILEGIQFRLTGSDDLDKFSKILTSQTSLWWDSLNKFWNKEIPFVGSDIDMSKS